MQIGTEVPPGEGSQLTLGFVHPPAVQKPSVAGLPMVRQARLLMQSVGWRQSAYMPSAGGPPPVDVEVDVEVDVDVDVEVDVPLVDEVSPPDEVEPVPSEVPWVADTLPVLCPVPPAVPSVEPPPLDPVLLSEVPLVAVVELVAVALAVGVYPELNEVPPGSPTAQAPAPRVSPARSANRGDDGLLNIEESRRMGGGETLSREMHRWSKVRAT